jgi:hypothetical protein
MEQTAGDDSGSDSVSEGKTAARLAVRSSFDGDEDEETKKKKLSDLIWKNTIDVNAFLTCAYDRFMAGQGGFDYFDAAYAQRFLAKYSYLARQIKKIKKVFKRNGWDESDYSENWGINELEFSMEDMKRLNKRLRKKFLS